MLQSQLQDLIRKCLPKLVTAGTAGLFPFSFESSMTDCEEFRMASPIVGSCLVYSEKVQLPSFIVLDHSGEKSISIHRQGSFFMRMTYQDIAVEYAVNVQTA